MQYVPRDGRGRGLGANCVDHGCYDKAHTANDIGTLAGTTPHALLPAAVVPHAGSG